MKDKLLYLRRQWQPTPVLLPGKSHGWRGLVGYSPWGHEESDTTEQLHFHFSLSCIGEGNDNPLQCSCLENPRNKGAWWEAVYGVAQSRTRLKSLSSSSSSNPFSALWEKAKVWFDWSNLGRSLVGSTIQKAKRTLVDPQTDEHSKEKNSNTSMYRKNV